MVKTSTSRLHGTVSKWNVERGFGFVTAKATREAVFVHISAFPRGCRSPEVGMEVTFDLGRDDQGRLRAENVTVLGASRGVKTVHTACLLAGTVLATTSALALMGKMLPIIPIGMVVLSVFAFLAYSTDKHAAQTGNRRVPENSLHLLALFGGWPGALIAQQTLRHKTVKQPFQVWFRVTIAVNVVLMVLVASGIIRTDVFIAIWSRPIGR